jgi:NAD(P)-dependent dehydrogenase (short-subunit alcohol dehydrogenase family)
MTPTTILVTGATGGIGAATALQLARQGHRVLCHGRTLDKADAAVAPLTAAGHSAEAVAADLSDLEAVRALAAEVTRRHPELSVLVNNAGIWSHERGLSAQGFELTFAVNHLAPFVLTRALLPVLEANRARVVTVSSALHTRARLDLDDLARAGRYDGMAAYNDSKLANVLFAFELARRHPGITSNALHPGVVRTGLADGAGGMQGWVFQKVILRLFGIDSDRGAATSVLLATDPSVEGVSGAYFSGRKQVPASRDAQDASLAARLWAISEEMTGS